MRRRILVVGALLLASLIIITGVTVTRYDSAFAAYFAPAPHGCGGG